MIECRKCKKVKESGDFSVCKKSKSGLNSICKRCDVEEKTIRYRKQNLIPSFNKCSVCSTEYKVTFSTKKRKRNAINCRKCASIIGHANRGGTGRKWKNNTKDEKNLYSIWQGIRRRCLSIMPNNKNASYLRKNIQICDEWKNNFDEFVEWSKKNGYTKNFHLDRINPNESYTPMNCRYIKSKDNASRVQSVILDDISLIIRYYNNGLNNIEIYNKLYNIK